MQPYIVPAASSFIAKARN